MTATVPVDPHFSARVRKARKARICPGCRCYIGAGHLYIEHTEFPGGDAGYADAAGHPVRMAECRQCAERYGRDDRFTKYESKATS